MKKLGQKLSFLTKIMLVVGLLISNLSSLSVVFAYEAPADVVVSLDEEKLEISYTKQLSEEVKAVNVKVYENYTYSDGTSEEEVVNVYSLTAEQLLEAVAGTLELTYDSMFVSEDNTVNDFELFDGTYSAKVEMIDVTDYSEETVVETTETENTETEVQTTETENTETEVQTTETEETTETVLAVGTYEETMNHRSGLNIRLFDSTGAEITMVGDRYAVSAEKSNVTVVAQILSGGLNPNDVFEYNGEEYTASELIAKEFSSEKDFTGLLFGEYELPVEVKVLKQLPEAETENTETVEITETEVEVVAENTEEVVYNANVGILYESYELNAALLNVVAASEGYGESYMFYSDSKDGVLYLLSDFETTETAEETVVTKTMLDLYNMLNVALLEEDETVESKITYTLLKDDVNVLESYVPVTEEDSLEDYLATLTLDETVQVVLSNEGLTVTYRVVVVGDLNNDNVLTQEDVLELIDQVVGESEITDLEKSDLYAFDGEVNSLDALYLNQMVNSQTWDAMIVGEQVSLNASLEVKSNGEELSEENYLTSGDEFTVDYVLSLTDYEVNGLAGVFNYDETLFELVSVKVANEWLGNDGDGKFLYLGEESLTGPELEVTEPENEVETENTESEENVLLEESTEEETVTTVDYVVLTATFRALSATDEESNNVITLDEIELFNSTVEKAVYYVLDQDSVSTEAIEVTASEDNTLSYLEVAGVEIALENGVYEYEITVANDITVVDLKYILNNVAAKVTSTVYPEELAEGSNTVVVTVTSESGVSQEYTITVVREEAPEEETTTQVSNNNYYNDYEEEKDEEVVTTPEPEEDDDEVEEESNLSKIVIIILILLVIAGLVYLIFKDEDDAETKKANKEVNKLKKESLEPEVKTVNKTSNIKTNNKTNDNKNKNSKQDSKNKKKER